MSRYTYDDLKSIMSRLRKDCPWDRVQTHESLRGAIIEEVYEFADAVDRHNIQDMCEELGDVLMLTVLHSVIAEESGTFTGDDVINCICRKMISRHSHVFGEDKVQNAEQAIALWEANKKSEKANTGVTDALRSVPLSLPALLRAQKVQSRAEKAGACPCPDTTEPTEYIKGIADIISQLQVANATHLSDLTSLVGNILWHISNFSRIYKINAEFALTNTIETFITRHETGEDARYTK